MLLRATWLVILVCGCTSTSPATAPGPVAPPVEGAGPATLVDSTDPAKVAADLVRLARGGQSKTLDEHVDWPWVERLAAMSGAFTPTIDDLVATLSSLPPKCRLEWRADDGGLRLDFPPAMTDDPPDVAKEKDALKKELYQGKDLVAGCVHESEDLYEDGHSELIREVEERFVVQLVRDDGGRWHIRGWSRLKK